MSRRAGEVKLPALRDLQAAPMLPMHIFAYAFCLSYDHVRKDATFAPYRHQHPTLKKIMIDVAAYREDYGIQIQTGLDFTAAEALQAEAKALVEQAGKRRRKPA